MAAILKIGNFVEFPIKLEINDAGKPSVFSFKLTAKRLTVPQWSDHFDKDGKHADDTVRNFLLSHITGWSGQTLVDDEATGQPSAFTPEAFALVLDLLGVQGLVLSAYLKAVQQAAAPEGKAKN